ncbi:MAG TPA: AsmA family protein, partial [Candidatus Binatia bacterium]
MKSPRKLLALIVITLVVAAYVLVQTFNTLADRNRDQVRQELQKVFGTDVNFDSLEVHWLGRLGFVARDFRVADDPRFAATPLLRARELILGVSVWNLFFRRFVISTLTFTEPEFQIIIDESGSLNLTTLLNRKDELRRFPKLPRASTDRKQNAVSFVIDQIRMNEGRVEYVDRSVKEPAELRVKHLSLTLQGFGSRDATKIRLTASLTEELSQDVKISGRLDPASEDLSWMHRHLDVDVQFDSLRVPVVARALAALRDKIPSELDVTGPVALHAKVGGTLQRPRIDDIALKIPLFGSSDYNAVVNGSIHFTERRLWEDAAIQGKFTVEPLALMRLRAVKFFEQNLPAALVADGAIGIYGRFDGTWKTLRLGALVRAEKAELRYKDSLRKPLGTPAELRLQISRQNDRFLFHESELVIGAQKIGFSGSVDDEKPPRLRLIVHAERSSVPEWNAFFTSSLIGVAGAADWQIAIQKTLSSSSEDWDVQGQLALTGAEIRQKDTGRKIENLNAKVSFAGQQARLNEVNFRIGRSLILLRGTVPKLLEPTVAYSLRSSRLNLADLPLLATSPPVELENMTASGVMQLQNEQWICNGSVTAPQGSLSQFGFRDLRADVVLTAASLTFKNLSAQVLNGRLRSDGYWAAVNQRAQQLEFSPQFDGLEIRALIAQLMPPLAGRFEGQLQGRARFTAAS